ncbi:Hypothetical protein GLP15_3184 [Giardia lamblia P15]|uniref:Uncharacterized protein n=1 Tax=Giardia intestinalis (strain P15) TaxID=658858 RepID=E1F964_GIAIA|nr:Hypothetical protein GLP15_3184 [Giardia lamblia P15]
MGDVKTATFKDLCPEDRAKIQKLLGELVTVKKEKELLEESVRVQSSNHRRELAKMKADNRNLMDRLRHYMSVVSQSTAGDGSLSSSANGRPKSAGSIRQNNADSLRDILSSKKPDTTCRGTLTEISMQSGRVAEVQTVSYPFSSLGRDLPPMGPGAHLVYPYPLQPMLVGTDQYSHELMALKAQVAALSSAVPAVKFTGVDREERTKPFSPRSATINNVKLSSTSARALGALPSVEDLNKSLPTLSLANSSHLMTSMDAEGRAAQEKSAFSADSLNISTYTPYVPISGSILDAIQETLPNLNYIGGYHRNVNVNPLTPNDNDQYIESPLQATDKATSVLSDITRPTISTSSYPSKPYDFSQSQSESLVERHRDPSKELLSLINHTHNFVTPPSHCSTLPEDSHNVDTSQGPVSEASALTSTAKRPLRKVHTPQSVHRDRDVYDIVEPPGESFTTPQVYCATAQKGTETPVKLEVIEPPSMLRNTPSPVVEQLLSRSPTSSSMKPMVTLPGSDRGYHEPFDRLSVESAQPLPEDMVNLRTNDQNQLYSHEYLLNFTERRPFPSDFDPSPPAAPVQSKGARPNQDIIVKSMTKASAEGWRGGGSHYIHNTQISDDTQTVVRFLNS